VRIGLARRLRDKRDHGWSQRHMSDYIDGDLSPRQQRRLEAHTRLCPGCGPLRRALTVLVWELRDLGRQPPSRSVSAGIIERIRSEPLPSDPADRASRL